MTASSSSNNPFRFDQATGWMIAGAFLLATMAGLSHALGERCEWLIIALVRAVLMLVTSVILVRSAGAKLAIWRPRTLWVRSLAGSFSLVCNFYALTRLPVADAITLMNVYPLWIVLISVAFLRRIPRASEILGVACGLAGVVLIEQPHLNGDSLAAIVALLSSASTAVAMLGLHRLRQIDSRAVVAHFAGVATLVSAILLGVRCFQGTSLKFELSPALIGLLLAVGASGTAGQIFLTKAFATGTPTKVATVGLVQVVFAMSFDVIFWSRQLTPMTLAGFVLVLAPTTWLSVRSSRPSTAEVVDERVPETSTRP